MKTRRWCLQHTIVSFQTRKFKRKEGERVTDKWKIKTLALKFLSVKPPLNENDLSLSIISNIVQSRGIQEMWSSCRRWMTRCTASLSSLQLGRQRILEWNIEMTSSYQRVNRNQERQEGVGSGLGNEILPTWLRINFLPSGGTGKAQQEDFSTQQGIVKTRTSHFFFREKEGI